MHLTDTYDLPLWAVLLGAIVVALLVLHEVTTFRYRRRQRRAESRLLVAVRQAWEPLGLDTPEGAPWSIPGRLVDLLTVSNADGTADRRKLERAERMNERYATAVAEIWELDSATQGGFDIDYLESLPHRLGLLTLTAAEMLALLGDYRQLVDEILPTLPRAGRSPRFKSRAKELWDRSARIPLAPGWDRADDPEPDPGVLASEEIQAAIVANPPDIIRPIVCDTEPDDVSPTARIAAEIADDWHAGTVATTGPLVEISGSTPPDPHHVAAQIADRRGHHDGHPVH